jgi:hypothetical protein
MTLCPRSDLFAAYWRFAAERQAIFCRRLAGQPPPWTDDPILQTYKFCNAYRASDRVSQFLIRDVICQDGFSVEDTLLRIILFRLFSRIETWQRLEAAYGPIAMRSFAPDAFGATLEQALAVGEPIYTNAFVLPSAAIFGYRRKHRNHLALLAHMLRDGLAGQVARARSLQALYTTLLAYPSLGPFLAYQLAIDINYSELVDFDENAFTQPGPGALRGIHKCFHDTGSLSPAGVVLWMAERQEEEFARRGLTFHMLWGRPLHAIDCQNLFCEVDKYARVGFPQLQSDRVRIKTRFVPSGPLPPPFYPPKWGLNEWIAARSNGATMCHPDAGGIWS